MLWCRPYPNPVPQKKTPSVVWRCQVIDNYHPAVALLIKFVYNNQYHVKRKRQCSVRVKTSEIKDDESVRERLGIELYEE